MRVGFFQYDVFRDRSANLDYIRRALDGEKFDLLVLPELFTSGYTFDSLSELTPYAESLNESPTVRELTEMAKRAGGCITGSIPEKEGDKIYNTAIMVSPEGLIGVHRKIHLPDYEKRHFEAGCSVEVVAYHGVNLGMVVCFDCWFPPLTSKLRQLGAQVVAHSSCFGGEVTPTIVPIRALENQFFIVSCNRIGTELYDGEDASYRGESQIVDPDGKVLCQAGSEEALRFFDIDLSKVDHPEFGSFITQDFTSEHAKYTIEL